MDINSLIDKAGEALQFAYAPYSNFKVGAALLLKNGEIYTGCNIENKSFTPTVCAERTAIFKAVSEGNMSFEKIVVITEDVNPSPPCGVCLQVLSEFVEPEFPVIICNTQGTILKYNFSKLLGVPFQPINAIGKKEINS